MTDQTQQTVSVKDAAAALGVSEGAILKRIERGTLTAAKDTRGRWQVTLSPDRPDTPPDKEPDTRQTRHQTRQTDRTDSGARLVVLEAENALLRELLATVTSERDYLRERLTDSQRALQQQQQLALVRDLPALTSEQDRPGLMARIGAFFRRQVG